jgi:hypothetical protein
MKIKRRKEKQIMRIKNLLLLYVIQKDKSLMCIFNFLKYFVTIIILSKYKMIFFIIIVYLLFLNYTKFNLYSLSLYLLNI